MTFATDGTTASFISVEVAQRLAAWTSPYSGASYITTESDTYTETQARIDARNCLNNWYDGYMKANARGRTAIANSLSTTIAFMNNLPEPIEAETDTPSQSDCSPSLNIKDVSADTASVPQLAIMGEPGWSLQDFQNQCLDDPNTVAGLVLFDIENDTGAFNYLVWQRNYTSLLSDMFIVTCDWPTEKRAAKTVIAGSTDVTVTQTVTTTTKKAPKDPLDSGVMVSGISHQIPDNGQSRTYTQAVDTKVETKTKTSTKGSTTSPTLTIRWLSHGVNGSGGQGSVPFISIAAAGTYLASRLNTQTSGNTTTVSTNTPTGSVSEQRTSSLQSNNSALPLGLGFVGGSLSSLSTLTIPGTNATTVLKSAAADLASNVAGRLQLACFDPSDPVAFQACRGLFAFKPPRVCDREAAEFYRSHFEDFSVQARFVDSRSCFPIGFVPRIPYQYRHVENSTKLPYDP